MPEIEENLAFRIGVELQIFHADFIEKRLGPLQPRRIDIYGEDFEFVRAGGFLQSVERGHFRAAGHAPGGPDVHQQSLALEGVERRGRAVGPVEGEGRHRFGVRGGCEGCDFALGYVFSGLSQRPRGFAGGAVLFLAAVAGLHV